jgi:hypothetical protein
MLLVCSVSVIILYDLNIYHIRMVSNLSCVPRHAQERPVSRCGGKLYLMDVGMAGGYFGNLGGFKCSDGVISIRTGKLGGREEATL